MAGPAIYRDLIIPRGKIQPHDQLLMEGVLVEVLKVTSFPRDWGDDTDRTFIDINYRRPDGKTFSADWPADQLEAVKRPVDHPADYDTFRSMLGEGTHTAFRKAIDSRYAMTIHHLIADLPDGDWGQVVSFVAEPTWEWLLEGGLPAQKKGES
jgi:hypothetical protein